MYNLTVDKAYTFFVGDGQWLVHNAKCPAVDIGFSFENTIRFADKNPTYQVYGLDSELLAVNNANNFLSLNRPDLISRISFEYGNALDLSGDAKLVYSIFPSPGNTSTDDLYKLLGAHGNFIGPNGGNIGILTDFDLNQGKLTNAINSKLGSSLQVSNYNYYGAYSPYQIANGKLPAPFNFPIFGNSANANYFHWLTIR